VGVHNVQKEDEHKKGKGEHNVHESPITAKKSMRNMKRNIQGAPVKIDRKISCRANLFTAIQEMFTKSRMSSEKSTGKTDSMSNGRNGLPRTVRGQGC
jgi:hypothetical protein